MGDANYMNQTGRWWVETRESHSGNPVIFVRAEKGHYCLDRIKDETLAQRIVDALNATAQFNDQELHSLICNGFTPERNDK